MFGYSPSSSANWGWIQHMDGFLQAGKRQTQFCHSPDAYLKISLKTTEF
jgi:hypothetical protein